ncbi:MAG TPA: RidA family protein [Kofleriaceae bacterium]|nr:RidA family protein [Kofleriaceae bacterium]
MSDRYRDVLAELGLTLPKVSTPAGAYIPTLRTGNLLFVAGQISQIEGVSMRGKLGDDLSLEQGQLAARLCALNILAHVDAAVDSDLERVRRCVRLAGFVNAVPAFQDHAQVLNGASELIVALFGERGRHVRAAIGAGSLPRGAAVEVEAVFELAP